MRDQLLKKEGKPCLFPRGLRIDVRAVAGSGLNGTALSYRP